MSRNADLHKTVKMLTWSRHRDPYTSGVWSGNTDNIRKLWEPSLLLYITVLGAWAESSQPLLSDSRERQMHLKMVVYDVLFYI